MAEARSRMRRTISLVARMVSGAWVAIWAASACARLISASGVSSSSLTRPTASAGDDQRAQRAIGASGRANLAQPVVHLEGERVVRRRAVEGDDADGALHLVEQLACHVISHLLFRPKFGS